MKHLKRSIVSLALVSTLAIPAFAQGEGGGRPNVNFTPNTVILVMPNGKVVERKMTDQHMADMIANGATPLAAGMMIMMHAGKVYVVQDKMMPNGKMLSNTVIEQ